MLVAEIVKGKVDDTGETVTNVYAKNSPNYAVYQTEDRVRIHYSDDAAIEKEQRTGISQLNPIRSEITGLIDGWRVSKNASANEKALHYSLRLSDGLIVALEEDIPGALLILTAVKQDIIDERTSKARFQYLTMACGAVIIEVAAVWLSFFVPMADEKRNLWLAAGAGTIGAFFSIAIAIRSRTILTDLHFRDNTSDAFLRILIGLIAGAFLVCCVESKLVSFIIDGAQFNAVKDTQWLFVLIMGFAGGFSERLVPDMLAKSFDTAKVDASALNPAVIKAAAVKNVKAAGGLVVAGAGLAKIDPDNAVNQNNAVDRADDISDGECRH